MELSNCQEGGMEEPSRVYYDEHSSSRPQLEPHVERLQREGNSAEASKHTADTSSALKLEGFKKPVFHSAGQTQANFTPTSSMFS